MSQRQVGEGDGRALASEDRVQINGLMEAVVQLTHVITGVSNTAAQLQPTATNAWARIMPRLWLNPTFKFPVSVKLRDAWLRWHCGDHPLRVVTSKMLPKTPPGEDSSERERQCVLRRKFKGVFEIIQGKTSNRVVDMDVEYVWDVSWNRVVTLFNISLPCNWVVSTAFDFFHHSPLLVVAAKALPSLEVPHVAAAAAARSAKVAEDARLFAEAAIQAPMARRLSGPVPLEAVVVLNELSDEAAQVVADAIAAVAGSEALQPNALTAPPPAQAHRPPPAPSPSRLIRGTSSVVAPADLAPAFAAFAAMQPAPADVPLHAFWPAPTNLWMPGAVQCARCCTTCRIGAWQSSHRGMLNHYRAIHDSVCQLSLKEANISGPDNVVVVKTSWCIRGINGDGSASTETAKSWMPCKRPRAASE